MMPWWFWLALVALVVVVSVIGAATLVWCWAIERMAAAEHEDEP
jgi:hypothetical protein